MIAIPTYKAPAPTLLAVQAKAPGPTRQALRSRVLAPLRALKRGAPLLALLLLTSCAVLGEREPTRIFEPAPSQSSAAIEAPSVQWSLLVGRPIAGALLDSDRITVRPEGGSVQVYKGANWSDAAPDLVQAALLRRFEDSRKILSVSPPGNQVRGDYQLVTELRAFDSIYRQPGQPQAVIEVYARLVHLVDGEVVAARTFTASQDAGGESVDAVVGAFSRSLDQVGAELVTWTLVNGQGHEAARPALPAAH